jgi:hypothetical protein
MIELKDYIEYLTKERYHLNRASRLCRSEAIANYLSLESKILIEPCRHFCSQVAEAITLSNFKQELVVLTKIEPHINNLFKKALFGGEEDKMETERLFTFIEERTGSQLKKSLTFQLQIYGEYSRSVLYASLKTRVTYCQYWLGRIYTAFLGVDCTNDENILSSFAIKLLDISVKERENIKAKLDLRFENLYRQKHFLLFETIPYTVQRSWQISCANSCDSYSAIVNNYVNDSSAIDSIILTIYDILSRLK